MKELELITKYLIDNKLKLSTVESCTGGLLSSAFTDISGSSSFITLNLVTYSNEAKHKILNIDNFILNNYGAVSPECAENMAEGLYNLTHSDICISTTGIAGPTGGSKYKPVGLMYSMIRTPIQKELFTINAPQYLNRIQTKKYFVEHTILNLYNFLGI